MKPSVSSLNIRISIILLSSLMIGIALSYSRNSQAAKETLTPINAVAASTTAPPLTTYTVTRTDDRNLSCSSGVDCSLREAVVLANATSGSVVINFSFTGTITLGAALPSVTNSDLSIFGPGSGSLTINQTSATARIFRATSGGSFSVSDVTISGGRGGALGGGAVLCGANPANRCTFTNVVFRNNRTTGTGTAGGAIANGGGGDLRVTNCTFGGPNAADANQATNNTGGAIAYDQVSAVGTLSITNSTFQGNNATFNGTAGGAVFVNSSASTMTISDSTFVNNHATGALGLGGAIAVGNGNPTVTRSRFFNNTAGGGSTAIFKNTNPGTVTAEDNWWGCDDFPGATGCDTVSGSVVATNRIDLVLSVQSGDLCPNGSKTLTADVSKNSAGTTINPTVMNGLAVNFALVGGPAGSSVAPASATISGFSATSNFNAGTTGGSATVSSTIDNGTQNASVTINVVPTITTSPADQTVCDGATASFTVAAGGTSPTIQWQVSTNGGGSFTDVSGANSATYTFTASQAQSGNKYRAVVTNSCGTATSNAATLTVETAPTVSTNPSSQTVCEGATASFTAAAGGSASTVQWQVSTNGGVSFSNISGATSNTLSFAATTSQSGNQYRAVFSNSCGTATTTAATLTVNANTTATQPVDQTVCQGVAASFSTTAGGTGPFHYAWTLDGSSFNGDSSSITVPTGSLSLGSHAVSVTVSGTCGSVTRNATLTVQENTTASTPSDQTVCQGATANFSTTASGTGTLHYAWTLDGSPFNGDSSSISVPTGSLSVGSHAVSVTVSGTCGSVTRNATLTVQENTTASTPADQTVCQGASPNFSTTASGAGTLHYAWTLDGSSFNGDSSSITVPTGSLSLGSHAVSVTVSGTCGSVTRNATLTVQENTTASTPADQTVCQGASPNFSTTASGAGTLHYAWTLDGSPFNGDSSSISVPTGSLSVGAHAVSVTVSGTCGSVTKNATLTVQENTATSDPPDQTVCQGANAGFTTTATGTGPFHYAWTLDGSPFNGDSSSITVPTGSLSIGNHTVSVTVSGACGSATQSAALTVNANTTATTPSDQTVCPGTNANFSTTAGGTGPFHYAWTVDGSPFNGDAANISVPTGSMSTGNHAVSVTVSGSCGSVTKNATLTVLQNTSTTDPPDQSVCLGGTASFSTAATGTGPFGFVWKKGATVLSNGDLGGRVSIVSGASTSTLTITNVQAGDFGTYTVEATGSCNTASQSANLSVNSTPPTITLNGANISFWPPDHSYHTVAVTDLVSGASSCDGTVNLNSVIIDHVTSDEVEDGNADGSTTNDIVIGCDRKSVQLRAERDGSADGRVYTIYFKVTDGLGHSTTVAGKVTVPKNQSGNAAIDSGPHYTVTNATCP